MLCPQYQRKMNRLQLTSIILIFASLSSCDDKDFTQKLLQEVINDATVTSELSRIDNISSLQFVNITPEGIACQIEHNGVKIKIPYNLSILHEVGKSSFRKKSRQLIVVNIEEFGNKRFRVNIYHPNSGLLLVSEVEFLGGTLNIVGTKIQSI